MSEIIQFNKFGELHNGISVFFCKTDFLEEEFARIKDLKENIILISGNSDYIIADNLVESMPQNIVHWFCHNNLSSSIKVTNLPIGIENSLEAKRAGHGVGWQHAIEKEKILSSLFEKDISKPTNLIYANFNISTNPPWRERIKKACVASNFTTYKECNLSYFDFISDILDHEAVVCPAGNKPDQKKQGGDNHRIYEVLYSNRIPIVFSENQHSMYEKLYKFLPVVLLEDEQKLLDKSYIVDQLKEAKKKTKTDIIKFSFWKKKILNQAWLTKR
ncbi:hypothetical protein CL622_05325 [archaeon]|nr:hypothetical protein [archaeon]|tara:strand:- start:68 stop:889 length:822 start_codon:yes stop_codon:yes gene_type:complete